MHVDAFRGGRAELCASVVRDQHCQVPTILHHVVPADARSLCCSAPVSWSVTSGPGSDFVWLGVVMATAVSWMLCR